MNALARAAAAGIARVDATALARALGRPFWQLVYRDGRVLAEWERDWLEADKRGVKAIRLLCPNGQVAELGTDVGDATGRVFQLKVARADAGDGGTTRHTLAHLIGLLIDSDGRCRCAAWEHGDADDGTPGRIVAFEDHFHHMAWQQLGALSAENLGVAAR